MRVHVNGEDREIREDATVQTLLQELGLSEKLLVVQKNGDIVERGAYDASKLADGDAVELVRLVGGG